MVDILLNNIYKIKTAKICSLILFLFFFQWNSNAQNYPDVNNIQQTYFEKKYEPHIPIKDYVIIIDHVQLLSMLKKHEKALVYVFVNGCTSDLCRPMYIYENWCKNNGYKLFLVMTSIRNHGKTTIQNPAEQLYVIDYEHYKRRAIKRFKNGLMGNDLNKKNKYIGNLLFFENGKYVKTLNDLPQA